METVQELIESKGLLERCFDHAWQNYQQQSKPQQEQLALNKAALSENQAQTDHLIETISSGKVADALFALLNKKANELKVEREKLLMEQRLMKGLTALQSGIDAEVFRNQLMGFSEVIEEAQPEEMQRLIRLLLKKVEWMPNSESRAQFYLWPKSQRVPSRTNAGLGPVFEGFATDVYNGSPWRSTFEPLVYRLRFFLESLVPQLEIPSLSLMNFDDQVR
jgi:hypothetical protein